MGKTKGKKPASESVAPVAAVMEETVPETPPAEAVDGEIDSIVARQKDGTLKSHLIKVVRAHAKKKIDEEEDLRWTVVATMTDAAIWEIVQWCEYERGATTQMSRHVNRLANGAAV